MKRVRAHGRQIFPPDRIWRRSDFKCVKKHSPKRQACRVCMSRWSITLYTGICLSVYYYDAKRAISSDDSLRDCQENVDNKNLRQFAQNFFRAKWEIYDENRKYNESFKRLARTCHFGAWEKDAIHRLTDDDDISCFRNRMMCIFYCKIIATSMENYWHKYYNEDDA